MWAWVCSGMIQRGITPLTVAAWQSLLFRMSFLNQLPTVHHVRITHKNTYATRASDKNYEVHILPVPQIFPPALKGACEKEGDAAHPSDCKIMHKP